jgi:uncharacterized Zn-binding protein involved in type VI secretion
VGDVNEVGGVIIEGDPTILVEGLPIAFYGAEVSPHPCCGVKGCPPIHCAAQIESENYTVLVGGFPIITVGDIDTCGDVRLTGAQTVIAGLPGGE